MVDFKDRVVVITGAASGIGREIALAFARRGARLALADIDGDGLRGVGEEVEALGARVYAQVVDVAVAAEVGGFCDNVYREMGRVDVLCNNAGVAAGGDFEHIGLDDWRWIVGINLMGVVYGCHFFYPRMIAQGGGGHIVNMASAAGLTPMPSSSPYSTTKFAVVGFSETLRAEAALHDIGVTALCPGFVVSGIYAATRDCSPRQGASREEAVRETEERLRRHGRTPDAVASALIAAVEKNRGVALVHLETRLSDGLYRLSRWAMMSVLTRAHRMGKKGMREGPRAPSGRGELGVRR